MLRRLRFAWRFREWPWNIPRQVVKYLDLRPLTKADYERTERVIENLSKERINA